MANHPYKKTSFPPYHFLFLLFLVQGTVPCTKNKERGYLLMMQKKYNTIHGEECKT